MGIVYKTCHDWIGRIRDYHVFHNTALDTYGVRRDDDRNESGDIVPPHCAYRLETILRLKDIPQHEIRAFVAKLGKES